MGPPPGGLGMGPPRCRSMGSHRMKLISHFTIRGDWQGPPLGTGLGPSRCVGVGLHIMELGDKTGIRAWAGARSS